MPTEECHLCGGPIKEGGHCAKPACTAAWKQFDGPDDARPAGSRPGPSDGERAAGA